jgi:alkylation response protein AidB-like acyl-CoA dehydrogenase
VLVVYAKTDPAKAHRGITAFIIEKVVVCVNVLSCLYSFSGNEGLHNGTKTGQTWHAWIEYVRIGV